MKKNLCILLAVALMLTSTVGCGSNSKANEYTPKEITVVDGKEMVDNMYVEGYPIVKDKVTINLMGIYETRQTYFEDMELFKEIEERTNVDINWELIPQTDWDQKKNLKLASGTYPDAFYGGITDHDITKYAPQGIFIPLDDLIDKYAPNIKKIFEKYPAYEKSCRSTDGKIYSLSRIYVDPGAYNPDQLFINKKWLDKLGLEVPTTMDEFYNVLMAFKTKDPNGNNKADEIPFTGRFNHFIQGYHSLFGAYGRPDFTGKGMYSHFIVEDGNKVVFTADKEEYRTAIRELHKFFKDGLFDQEIFTQDVKQYFAKGKTEDVTVGSFMLWNRGNMVGPERAKDYVPVPPLKGSDADPVWIKEMSGNSPVTEFAITSQCKYPEIIIRWIDQFFDEELSVRAAWGPIVKSENGPATFAVRNTDQSFDDYRFKNAPIFGPCVVYEDYYGRVVEMPDSMVEKYEIMKEHYEKYMTATSITGLKLTPEETEWFTANAVDINNYVNDHQARWLLEGGVDEEWDKYIEGLKALNIDKHIEMMTEAYNRNYVS